MENYKQNVAEDNNSVRNDSTSRITFEYTFPTGGVESMDDESTTSSNKSTPYYTPLEFFQNSFEFPSPVLDKTHTFSPKRKDDDIGATELAIAMETATVEPTRRAPKASSPGGAFKQQLQQSQSPALSRKMRRFSLYERRSCSPQHMLLRDAGTSGATEAHGDKENTKPRHCDKFDEPASYLLANSGNNSPKLGPLIDESSSPKILTIANESGGVSGNTNTNSSRLIYSPKLLASISNLNLSGSPLSLINSASYKNGNYFKFPEIDQIVQSETIAAGGGGGDGSTESSSDATVVAVTAASTSTTTKTDNQQNQRLSINNETQSTVPAKVAQIDPKTDLKKNRKNKNNLTIKIKEPPTIKGNTPSPSPKLKTPTIKNTKEKALSLDSAAVDSEPKKVTFGASCDEIDSNAQNAAALLQLRQRRAMTTDRYQYAEKSTNHSTSLSHLTTLTDFHGATPAVFVSKPGSGSGSGGGITRTPRRRVMAGSSSNDWLQYHRKQNPYNLSVDSAKRSASDTDSSEKSFFDGDVVVLHEDDEVQCEEAETQFIQIPTVVSATATPRNVFKHNPLLHSSSTNLKTLPEFLTLVEFNAGSNTEHRSPYKQKSMELPITAQQPCMNTPAILHTKHVGTSNSSTNLLQRRGSNHSLTLNLHGSCSNLLGSCRSGLSVSNYSLGSVGNSTSNLNVTQSSIVPTTATPAILSTQNAKQSLFRRRGSNHSLTLTNLTATSCGNLNTFASQNSLNIDKAGVTRTTSFITPTNNTASSTNTSFVTKKGLLERRGSNQSLTLNMNSTLAVSSGNIHDTLVVDMNACSRQQHKQFIDPNCCSHTNQRKFFSSENLNKSNAPFGDLNQTHKRNANQVCFGSVSDLKPRDMGPHVGGVAPAGKRDSSEFPESSVCTCTGVRNIMTRPLSPQATSEEFKIYLAGIQMLQNASNPLNQEELIKLNFIFDNSYATNKNLIDQPLPSVLNMHSSRDVESPLGITYTSDDFEVVKKYEEAVHDILHHVRPNEEEQKRMFRDLHKEFWDLPLNHQEKPMVFGSQTKNRYKTILPNENSRFILAKEEQGCDLTKMLDENNVIISTMDKHNGSSVLDEQPYINANYIKGPDYASKCYVATQGPLPNTIFEFWLMVFQNTKRFLHEANDPNASQCYGNLKQYYQKIVMLTNFLENNRQKCSVYFPVELHEINAIIKHQETWHLSELAKNYFNEFLMASEDKEFSLNDEQIKIECITTTLTEELARELPLGGSFFVIKNVGIVRKNGFSIRKLVMLYCMQFSEISNAVRQHKLCINRLICYHYWYPDWPDHRSPRDINALLDICLHILNLGKCESEFENFNLTDESLKAHLMAQKIDAYQQDLFNAVQPLPVIHCSAGIGRTGCLTAILNAIRQLRQSLSYSLTTMAQELRLKLLLEPVMDEDTSPLADSHWNLINLCNDTDSSFTRNTLLYILHIVSGQQLQEKGGLTMNAANKRKHEDQDDQPTASKISVRQLPKLPDIFVDCLGIVCNLRLQRGGMVQNSEQYELIHRAICLYMKRTFALKRF